MRRLNKGRNRFTEEVLTAETRSSQSPECIFIKNSLLRALRASAVRYPNSGSDLRVLQRFELLEPLERFERVASNNLCFTRV